VHEPAPTVLITVEQLRRRVPGGIGAYARGLLAGLDQCAREGDRIDVTLLASRPPLRIARDPLSSLGRPVRTTPWPGPVTTRAWDHGWLHAPKGFDIVHSVSLAAPPPHRSSGSHLVVTVHDVAWRRHPDATTNRGRRWHEAALKRARDRGAALVVSSRLVASDLTALGVDAGSITVVRGGTDHLAEPDPVATAALLQDAGVSGDFLLTVGTREPRKNLDRLVLAYSRLRPSLPSPWPLVVVGPTGWGHEPPRTAETEGVLFTGAVSDRVLADLYRRARAFAYVPLTEGYGLPPLEAMRSGTPTVVSSEVPSVNDLDREGPAPAQLVDPLDVDDIAAGLAAVLTDDDLRAELAARGSAHVLSRTWRGTAREHLALWRRLQ
jgi:glycosyltransferase involved in cell wall biosynthesis